MNLGITIDQCRSAAIAGDTAFYKAAGCAQTAMNDQLLVTKKSELNKKTIAIIVGVLLITGTIVFFATKKKKS
ncbi:MAG: LPXTG cell wall anchor domain-containing protein [Shewanella sp.]